MNFETGKTYAGRSVCDHDCVITVKVVARTAKTIKAETARGTQTFRVGSRNGVEFVKPWGSYSMAPFVFADRVQA